MNKSGYILGLDIGANSIGWTLLNCNGTTPTSIEKAGVRIFDAGIRGYATGKEESSGVQRRDKRQIRRQTDRSVRRLNKLFALLRREGLLPGENIKNTDNAISEPTSLKKDKLLKKLDAELIARWRKKLAQCGENDQEIKVKTCHNLPYLLRASGLDEKLELDEIGRALYHIAQRRGFLSIRKKAKTEREKEEEGEIAKKTHLLQIEMDKAGARTLGEYFLKFDPFATEPRKIRERYTLREMYKKEFELLWNRQAEFHPDKLTAELKERIYDVIFSQRPLKSQKHLVGRCAFEPDHKRAPWAILESQRFRMLQQINHTQIIVPTAVNRQLTPDEIELLISELEKRGDITFTDAKKLLGLPNKSKFAFEEGGETRFIGNRTAATILKILGQQWEKITEDVKRRIVTEIINCQNNESGFPKKLAEELSLNEKTINELKNADLEPRYCNFSKKALNKLLPLLEEGLSYAEAAKKIYGDRPKPKPLDLLPSVADYDEGIRNPVVFRSLTELRKVVNAIVKTHGKPQTIKIELARDIKKNKKQREETWKRNRHNESERKKAAEAFLKEIEQTPSSQDILKVMLAEEANWRCPYTNTPISFSTLGNFDIEHIIPFSRCFDNSYVNKTLCLSEENKNRKSNKTPFEAYSGNPERWNEILTNVKNFKGNKNIKMVKLNRFMMESPEDWDDFVSRQLNDTRYASRVAMDYLGLLYGGVIDNNGTRRIQAGRGNVTAFLRNEWRLNSILGDGGKKSRDDHRHHAIDAIAIALTDSQTFKTLSEAAKRAKSDRRRLFGKINEPWEGFLNHVKESIEKVVVSHRVSHKISGALHEDTIYSRPIPASDGKSYVHVRKKLSDLSPADLKKIVDEKIKSIIRERLKELGYNPDKITEREIQKTFSIESNLPFIRTTDKKTKGEKRIPIKKVRIRKSETVMPIGSGFAERHVVSGLNSHIEIFEETTKKDKIKWVGKTVTMFEAVQRLKNGMPVVNRGDKEGKEFVCSLANGDTIELETAEKRRELFVIKTITIAPGEGKKYARIFFTPLNEAKPRKLESSLINQLQEKLKCRKVLVTPLGEVRHAND